MFTQERDNDKPEGGGRYRLVPSDPQPTIWPGSTGVEVPAGWVHVMLVPDMPDMREATAQEVAG